MSVGRGEPLLAPLPPGGRVRGRAPLAHSRAADPPAPQKQDTTELGTAALMGGLCGPDELAELHRPILSLWKARGWDDGLAVPFDQVAKAVAGGCGRVTSYLRQPRKALLARTWQSVVKAAREHLEGRCTCRGAGPPAQPREDILAAWAAATEAQRTLARQLAIEELGPDPGGSMSDVWIEMVELHAKSLVAEGRLRATRFPHRLSGGVTWGASGTRTSASTGWARKWIGLPAGSPS